MGIQPTESWKKGSKGKYAREHKFGIWCLNSPLPESNTNLYEHIEALLCLLRPRIKEIQLLSEKYETYLVCTGSYDDTASPGLCISKENVQLLALLGLAIDADLYFGC
jgi:hypothetical protein